MAASACNPARTPADYILIPVVISFGLGITWAKTAAYSETLLFLCSLLLAALILAGNLARPTTFLHRISICLLLPFFLITGVIYAGPFLGPPEDPRHIYNQIKHRQQATISGTLKENPYVSGPPDKQKTRLLMIAETLHRPAGDSQTNGLVRLSLPGPPPPDLLPGDRFMVIASLSRPDSFSTPGAFNYGEFLASQSIWISGWIKSPLNIVELRDLSASSFTHTLRNMPERIRYRIADFLDHNLTDRSRGLYKAILIGDRGEIPPAVSENFKAAGCAHILAISGLHMGLLGLISIALLNWLLKRSTWLILHVPVMKLAALLSLLPLIFYALIAGMNTPVVRALIMVSAFIFALFFDRQKSIITNIAIAALLIMIWQPAAIFTASFQLSFAAVIAIAAVIPRISLLLQTEHQPGIKGSKAGVYSLTKNWLLAALLVSVAAVIGTAPLLLYYFNRISILSPLSNLLVEPLICYWALLSGLLACLLLPFSPTLAAYLINFGAWALLAAEKTTAFFADLPFSSIWLPSPTPMEIAAYYLLLFSLLKIRLRFTKILFVFSTAILIFSQVHTLIDRRWSAQTDVSFLDVGQGNAAVIELPRGAAFLIDSGGPASPGFDVGEKIVARFLWHQRLHNLDGIIITHPHADHYNGLFFIIEHFRPKEIWINGQTGPDPAYQELLAAAGRLGIPIKVPLPGTMLYTSDTVLLQCVAGPGTDKTVAGQSQNPNRNSLVLRLEHRAADKSKSVSFLFPGDIENEAEKELISKNKNIKADILLSPHHGSATSNSRDFIEAVSPKFIVVSAGSFNKPLLDPELNRQGLLQGVKVYNTTKDGTISFSTDGEEIKIKTFLLGE